MHKIKTRFNIQTLGNLIKWLSAENAVGWWVLSATFSRHVQACQLYFLASEYSRGPPEAIFQFSWKDGEGISLRTPFSIPSQLVRTAWRWSFMHLIGDQNGMYVLSCHVGCWQNGSVTPCSIFQPVKFYQLMCLSKINCCVTCCNLFFVGFVWNLPTCT